MSEQIPIDAIDPVPERKPRAKKNGDGRAVARVTETPPAPAMEGDAFLQMIERAARDPSVDIDKMERLFAMRERMHAQQAKAAFLAALAEMQPNLPVIDKRGVINKNEKDDRGNKTGNQVAMTKYAKWEDVVEGITPVLAQNGFSLSFRTAQPSLDRIVVSGVLGHRDGHTEETSISLPIDATGAKNNVQGWGSSVSYGKRYTAFALLNISARGEDDDGKAADMEATITSDQVKQMQDMIKDANANAVKFLSYLSKRAGREIGALTDIPASLFAHAMEALEAKQRAGI